MPLAQLTDRTAPLDALGWHGVATLEEQLAESAEPAVRLSRLEEALSCRRARTRARAEAGTPGAIDLIERTHGALSIRDVTRATGLSGRALERAFRRAVGVSPKRFARIVRFRGAVSLLQRHPGLRPARVAADLGYYDEAHLIRDFGELAGTTPAAFAREWREVGFVQYGAPGSATP